MSRQSGRGGGGGGGRGLGKGGESGKYVLYTVDSHYLKVQGTLLSTSRYPYLDISDLQN